MEKIFEFNSTTVNESMLEVKDIFQLCIEAHDNNGLIYYLCVHTDCGISNIVEFGPIADSDLILPGFSLTVNKTECKAPSVIKYITKFLGPRNGNKAKIVFAKEIDIPTLVSRLPDIQTYIETSFTKESI